MAKRALLQRYLPSPWGVGGRRVLLITGCRDTQTSADTFINGRYNGALTYGLVSAIRKAKGKLTYQDLHDRVSAVLKQQKFDQVPQLEGRRVRFGQPLFAG